MMTSLTSSSRLSSSSYHTSARYSTSSSYRSEGSTRDPLFVDFLDPSSHDSLFGEEGSVSSLHSRGSYGCTGSTGDAVATRKSSIGAVRSLADSYYLSVDVSRFDPFDIVVMAYNHHIFIHAQKVLEDGSVCDTFTHKSLLPEDMDPLSVSGTLGPDGVLVVSVRRTLMQGPALTYCTEAHL